MQESSSRFSFATILLFVAVCGLAIGQFYNLRAARSLEARMAAVQEEQNQARNRADVEIAKLREAAAADSAERQKAQKALREEVDRAGRLARGAAGKVKEEALQSFIDLTARLRANEQKMRE